VDDTGHPYSVYVLWSATARRFYVGVTDDVLRRLHQHNAGLSTWTRRHAGSWRLVWERQTEGLSVARRLEASLKRQKGGEGFTRITGLRRDLLDPPGS